MNTFHTYKLSNLDRNNEHAFSSNHPCPFNFQEIASKLGERYGDEGKGKIVDWVASEAHIVARFQGGNNAGHTLYVDGKKIVLVPHN